MYPMGALAQLVLHVVGELVANAQHVHHVQHGELRLLTPSSRPESALAPPPQRLRDVCRGCKASSAGALSRAQS